MSMALHLHVPAELGAILRRGAFPADPQNPIVSFEFINGHESLFDTRKGLFLNPPADLTLPPRETLKAFGEMIQNYRRGQESPSREADGETPIGEFAVCC